MEFSSSFKESQGLYGLQGPTKENTPTSPFETTHSSCTKQTLHTRPGVTYAHITKQDSYAPTNIEQGQHINQPHQQTSDIQKLKKIYVMKSLFERTETMLNLLTTMLNELK
jgi:hypothetical protein